MHTAAYTYNVEGYDLPQGAEESLFAGPFEAMVSESYDWWTLAFTVPYSSERLQQLGAFEVCAEDDTGVRIESLESAGKVKIIISCRMASDGDWMDTESDPFEPFVPRLLDLRDEVIAGDFSGLRLVVAQFDPETWQEPEHASTAAEWLARNIEP